MPDRILSLDISSKTGWCLLYLVNEEVVLENYGVIKKIDEPAGVPYPDSYVDWSSLIFEKIEELVNRYAPDRLVIEETSKGSKNAYSQKILEFSHYQVAKMIKETQIPSHYLMTGEWRRIVGSFMSAEEKAKNKEVKDYKRKNKTKLAKDSKGKVMGKVTKKHVSVRRANELFGLSLKIGENDIAEAILLGYAYILKNKGRSK